MLGVPVHPVVQVTVAPEIGRFVALSVTFPDTAAFPSVKVVVTVPDWAPVAVTS